MKKITIGYIFNEPYLRKDEKFFIKVAKEKNIDLIMINSNKDLSEEEIEKDIKKCDIFFNNSAEDFSFEIAKTIEELGKKVIDSSKNLYYDEDKWMFFLKCQKHKIPTIRTILLSRNIGTAKKELEEFNSWPVILKRIQGTMGEYVERAENINGAEKIINRFWKKGAERLPIIAQEFVPSQSYRVTTIGNRIVQTAIKKSKGWKATGVYIKDANVEGFEVDKKLRKIIDKVIRVFGMKICGIDLLKKGNNWLVLEINSAPGLDFFEKEEKKLVGEILDFLKKEARATSRK